MSEDANRVLAKIYWSVNTTNGKSGVELLWAGSGSSANATIGFFSGRGFHDYFTAGNSMFPNNATLVANTSTCR